jgi:cystathionine beta-lyase
VLAGDDLYGGTFRLLERCAPRSGLRAAYVDATDPATRRGGDRRRHAPLLVEDADQSAAARLRPARARRGSRRARGVLFAVDGSLMSPWLQRPLELGADVVVHSATKHLAGHGDVMAGALAVRGRRARRRDRVPAERGGQRARAVRQLAGPARAADARRAARARAGERAVRSPASSSVTRASRACTIRASRATRGARLHFAQADGAGALVSFETGDAELSRRLVEALALFTIAGQLRQHQVALASLPCRMSHKSVHASRRWSGVLPDDLVRLSIGLEDPADLVQDLEQAFALAARAPAQPASEPALAQAARRSRRAPRGEGKGRRSRTRAAPAHPTSAGPPDGLAC